MFKFKNGDVILITCLLAISAISFIQTHRLKETGESILIYQDDNLINEYQLNIDQTISIQGALGLTILSIKNNNAVITDSPCPYHFCQKMGSISKSGQMLVCVPNKIVIKISGSSSSQLDAITE